MTRSPTVAHERPILFSAAMVRAILDGRKTQTRRVFVPPPPFAPGDDIDVQLATGSIAPRSAVGDRLWVRESFAIRSWDEDGYFWFSYTSDGAFSPAIRMPDDYHERVCARLSSAGVGVDADGNYRIDEEHRHLLRRASIHMPRAASRITLEVTEVRVQRLQDISEEDARAEGVLWVPGHGEITPADLAEGYSNYLNCREGFQVLWTSIHGPGSWDANPWVVAITFRRIDQAGGHHG